MPFLPKLNFSDVFLLAILFSVVGAKVRGDDSIDFNRDIRPLLATHCLTCHGPDESTREASLRLDQFDSAIAEGESGEFAIVPGKPEASELLRRVQLDESDSDRMPPSGKGLNSDEVELLRKWIAGGASFDRHWAFVEPKKSSFPKVKNTDWGHNGIDRYVLARLEKVKLSPNGEANKYLLVRRVYIDLLGLPPTIEEADRFVNDLSPGAYENMVDRVLASPRFGERWGQVWLDLARYADSQGYAQDSPRTIYRYRDWVIDALNDNLPFDQFTVEQMAGDMLPDPTPAQVLATAFHRNTMTNSEGGTDNEEFRSAAIVDRVNTTMQVWMGMTMGCAQCHTHKYDPITHEEYFQVYAILNQTEDADRNNEAPLFSELSTSRQLQKQVVESQIAEIRKKLAAQKSNTPKLEPLNGPLKVRYLRVQGLGKMFLHLGEVEVFGTQKAAQENLARKGVASQSSTAFGGPAKFGNDGNTSGLFSDKSTTHTAEEENPWWEVDLKTAQQISKVTVWNRTDGGTQNRLKAFRVIAFDEDRRPLWTTTTQSIPNPSLSFEVPQVAEKLTAKQTKALTELTAEIGFGVTPEEKRLQSLTNQLQKITQPDVTTPIMKQLPEKQQRVTKIHLRGNFRSQGKVVAAAVPKVFHEIQARNQTPDRLDFARWLVDRKNPVTSRVIVNRFWERMFGIGIVETSEDFGTQGELPSHQELLDYLALEFIEQGWDVKWLLKEIVTSATYRQSSKVTAELQKRDPRNRLLARGPRFRLPAEMIRDQALAISGVLSSKMNGPSVRPPKPKLGLRAAFGGTTDWDPSPGEDAYRRGLYTTWRRTSPYPSMTTFDAPSREFCTIRRSRTNTPLQALVTLNDPVYVGAARSLAKRVFDSSATESERMVRAFRETLIRPPSEKEVALMTRLLQQVRGKLDEKDAALLAEQPVAAGDPVDFASWVVLCNVLLNLDEAVARP